MKVRRDHFIEIITHFKKIIKDFFYTIILLIISLFGEGSYLATLSQTVLWFLVPFVIILAILKWYFKTYTLDENHITVRENVISKKEDRIPYGNIRSINTEDTILKRLLSVEDLFIELIGGEEVSFTVKKTDVKELINHLSLKANLEPKSEVVYISRLNKNVKFGLVDYLCVAVSDARVFSATFFGIVAFSPLLMKFLKKWFDIDSANGTDDVGILEKIEILQESDISLSSLVLTLLILLLIQLCVTYVVSIPGASLIFGKFKLISKKKDLTVAYGTFKRVTHNIKRKNIRSVRISETIIHKLLGRQKISIDNIGTGKNSIVINPSIKKDESKDFLESHFPGMIFDIEKTPTKNSLVIYILKPVLACSILIGLLMYFDLGFVFLIPFLLLPFLYGMYNWKNTGIKLGEEFTILRRLNGLTVENIVSENRFVQDSALHQPFTLKDTNIFHVSFGLYLNNSGKKLIARHIELSEPERALNHSFEKC